MMKKIFAILTTTLLLAACTSQEEKRAEQLFKQAEQAHAEGKDHHALALLDSIEHNCKQAIEWRKAGHQFGYEVQLAIQQDSLATADTMLVAITKMINEMIDNGKFVYEKGEYDELGRFYVKGTDTQSNLNRNYIHATVNDYGVIHLISEYRGGSYINHTQMKFIATDNTESTTAIVPLENEGANYHFKNQGVCHESVTYVNDPVFGFIDMHYTEKKFRAALLYNEGTKSVNVDLSEQDRTALSMTYQLSQLLAAQLLYTQQSKVAGKKIQFLQAKMTANGVKNEK